MQDDVASPAAIRKAHWVIWSFLAVVVTVGAVVFELSSRATAKSIELTPGATVDLEVFRPRADALRLSLEFERRGWQDHRPELGTWSTRGDWRQSGHLEFVDPGSPVLLAAGRDGKRVVYEAMPRGGYNETTLMRTLVPWVDDGSPSRFPWPPDLTKRLTLPAGTSRVEVRVFDVGKELRGQMARLIVQPPAGLKSTAHGYEVLVWFMFWPAYLGIVLVYGSVLLWLRTKRSGRSPADP